MAGSAGAIRAGAAYVELFVKDNALVRGLERNGRRLQSFGFRLAKIGGLIQAGGMAIVGPMLAAAKAFAAAGDQLDKMSARTGASVEFLSALGHAAQLGGSDLETMEKAVRRLQGSAYDAARGMSTQVDAFNDLGVSVKTASGQLKPTEALFLETVTALSRMENETQKAAIAQKVFGRAGTQLLPMLRDEKAGLAAAMEEAKRLGLVMSEEDARSAAGLTDALYRLQAGLKMVWVRLGGSIATLLTETANRLAEVAGRVSEWVHQNKPLLQSLFKIGLAVVGVGAAITAVGMAVMGLGATLAALSVIVQTVAAGVGLIAAGFAALLSPIGLVTAAVVGLGAYLVHTTGAGAKAIEWLSGVFGQLQADALKAFDGIRDALAAGDISLAAKILWLALKLEWQKGVDWLYTKWLRFKDAFQSVWTEAVYGLAEVFVDAVAKLETVWVGFSGWFVDRWKWAEENVAKGLGFIIAKLQGLDPAEVLADVGRQYGLASQGRQEARNTRLQEIEQEREARLGTLGSMRDEADADRRRRHAAELAGLGSEIAMAQAELDEALKRAKEARRQEEAKTPGLGGPGTFDFEQGALAGGKVFGTFSAAAALRMGFGAGSAQERTAKASEEIAENTRPLKRVRQLSWS